MAQSPLLRGYVKNSPQRLDTLVTQPEGRR